MKSSVEFSSRIVLFVTIETKLTDTTSGETGRLYNERKSINVITAVMCGLFTENKLDRVCVVQ